MASSTAPDEAAMEPPRKRQRLSPPPSTNPTTTNRLPETEITGTSSKKNRTVMESGGFQPEREAEVGILQFVNSTNVGFTGVLKQRYTDFMVNEVTPDGTVAHLTDDKAPKHVSSTKQHQETTIDAVEPQAPVKVDEFVATSAPIKAEEAEEAEQGLSISFAIAPGDHELLTRHFGTALKDKIIQFHDNVLAKPGSKPGVFGAVFSDPINEKQARGRVHSDIRRIFVSRLETEAIEDNVIKITAAYPAQQSTYGRQRPQNSYRQQHQPNQLRGKLGWKELGGEFLHFSLYKENKDTMEVISFLAKMLKIKPKDFNFAGTKDRRAVTVQRVSVYRQRAEDLVRLNSQLRQARIGNFKYETQRLELGENGGNQFTITLRDCHFGGEEALGATASREALGQQVLTSAVEHLKVNGFINYYGLQRFGTFGIGTDEVGKHILKGKFEDAVDAILHYSEESLAAALNPQTLRPHDKISRDDVNRAHAIYLFNAKDNSHLALQKMPHKFSAEKAIIQHLGSRQKRTDYLGALLLINRGLRTMYVHAYQSFIWNHVASERWARYGSDVVEGDLVIVDGPARNAAETQDEVDDNGEVVVRPAADDFAVTHDDIYERARALTKEDISNGKYSIFDIVLPTPGYDVEYPQNDIGDFYKKFMGSTRGGGLDPGDMRRKQKDFSLSGNYRKLMGQVGSDATFEVKSYVEETEQLVETDLEKLYKSKGQQDQSRKDIGRRNQENHSYNNRSAEVNAKLSAWHALPEKLAADDKAARAAAQLAKLSAEPVNSEDIKQPIYKQTFIEKVVDKEGRRTGLRLTKLIGADGKELTREEAEAYNAASSKAVEAVKDVNDVVLPQASLNHDAMEVDKAETAPPAPASGSVMALGSITNTTNGRTNGNDSSEDDEEGGVRLTSSPKKTSRLSISTSTSTSPRLNPTAPAFIASGRFETPSQTENSDKTVRFPVSPPLNPAAAEFVAPNQKLQKAVDATLPSKVNTAIEEGLDVEEASSERIGVIIKFSLGTSQYATVALRELMKLGGVKTYKPDYSSGRG